MVLRVLLALAAIVAGALLWWTGARAPAIRLGEVLRSRFAGRGVPALLIVSPRPPARPATTSARPSAATSPSAPPPEASREARLPRAPVEPWGPAKAAPRPGVPTFAIEFGPFFSRGEADRVEHRLNQAGYPTATYRQRLGASVYGVFVERVPSQHEAQVLVATLREQGFPEAMVIGSRDPYAVRAGEPAPLRVAVQMAERLREKGHIVRVSAEAGEAAQFMIRHGSFLEREEAEWKSRDLVQLGLLNRVVRVK